MEKFYEINKGTLCLIQNNDGTTKVYEEEKEYIINKNIHKIVDESCKSFGSSLKGRYEGTTKLTGVRYKAPIIISEYLSIIMLPTGSTRGEICHWFSLSSIKNIEKNNYNNAIVNFYNGKSIELDISFFIMQNQLDKATRLDYFLRKKYNEKN